MAGGRPINEMQGSIAQNGKAPAAWTRVSRDPSKRRHARVTPGQALDALRVPGFVIFSDGQVAFICSGAHRLSVVATMTQPSPPEGPDAGHVLPGAYRPKDG
jgi:hypothetical protein